MDKSIEWRWSVGEENVDIANNNNNYQFMSIFQLPEPSCIHIRSPALSHRQRMHMERQQRQRIQVQPEEIREAEVVNDQPDELKKLAEVAADLTTQPQEIETTTVIHRRAKYGSRKQRKRKRKRRKKKPRMPPNSISEPDPGPKDYLNKMEMKQMRLNKKEKTLKNRLKKLEQNQDSEHSIKKSSKKRKGRKKNKKRKKKKKNSSPCQKKWEHQNGMCYRAFTRKRRSYRVASKYCGRKHAADLFTPKSEDKEMAYFASWLAAKHLYNKKYRERMRCVEKLV